MWGDSLLKKMSNAFWAEVIENWQVLCRKQQPKNNLDVMNTTIWYNPDISKEPLYLSNWFKAGVLLLGDILNTEGEIEPFEKLKERYDIKCNIFEYYRLKLSVQKFVGKFSFGKSFIYSRPSCPFHLQILYKSRKGVKDFYETFLNHSKCSPTAQIKWQSLVDKDSSNFWSIIYKICFKSINNNNYIWFQYKTINNILGTRYHLYKVKISESNQCR